MRIAIRGGHNYEATGSVGIIDEVVEDRRVCNLVIKWLKIDKQSVLDVSPKRMDSHSDLKYGVSKANEWNADLFISIHFNKAYDSYDGEIGTETWANTKNHEGKKIASRITKNISRLGFKNRGVKDGLKKGFYEIKRTKMTAIIVEVCFVEATGDVKLYKKVGADAIAKAIAEGIVGHKIKENNDIKNRYGVITASILNIRSGPGTQYRIIGQLREDMRVQLYKDCGNGWYDIYFGDSGGYVSKKYIELL